MICSGYYISEDKTMRQTYFVHWCKWTHIKWNTTLCTYRTGPFDERRNSAVTSRPPSYSNFHGRVSSRQCPNWCCLPIAGSPTTCRLLDCGKTIPRGPLFLHFRDLMEKLGCRRPF
jgi:hypothetical protein